MRKIEREMVAAIKNGRGWKSGNTRVEIREDGVSVVYLHGNRIAIVMADGSVMPDLVTFRRWPTVTTRSRLVALGVNAAIRNFAPTIDGREI